MRPGEAIHNDRGGDAEANKRFQVAWLPEGEQAEVLGRIRERAEQAAGGAAASPVVFEGGAAAELDDNDPLRALREGPAPEAGPEEPRFWVGEPIALAGPLSVKLERLRNGHVAIAGGGEGDRRDFLLNVAAGLEPQYPAPPEGQPGEGLPPLWAVLAGGGAGLAERVIATGPAGTRAAGAARVDEALSAFHAELKRREDDGDEGRPAAVLALLGLERMRGLEPEEEAFSMPSFDDPPPPPPDEDQPAAEPEVAPGNALAALVDRGAAVGLHLLVLADGAGPLESVLGRNGLRNFNTKVLFQMSANDSAALTDTTEASGLGPLRGLLFREDRATAEPFRPYRAAAPRTVGSAGSSA